MSLEHDSSIEVVWSPNTGQTCQSGCDIYSAGALGRDPGGDAGPHEDYRDVSVVVVGRSVRRTDAHPQQIIGLEAYLDTR